MVQSFSDTLYVAVALDDWKAFVEKEVELGYICNVDEINQKTSGKWRAVS
jgi:hypothetical protein